MQPLEEKSINTIRFLAVDMVEKARSGHPGLPMGGAAVGYTLWSRILKHCPDMPCWPDRDRFVLSAGHGSALLYALLHLFGYDLSLEDLKKFRQWGSKTPGHPEFGKTSGVETTTGPLGQGFANAVGMALAEERLAAEFNRPGFNIVDHYTYIYAGDGCMMEGITSEAASLAGHLQLSKLICLYDDNRITIDGRTEIAFTENVGQRFEAYRWQVLKVEDGNDIAAVQKAIEQAKKDERPSLIIVRTEIGYGSPGKQGTPEAHGAPLGAAEVQLAKTHLDWPLEPVFHVPSEVQAHFADLKLNLIAQKESWDQLMNEYTRQHPEPAARWALWLSGKAGETLAAESSLWEFAKPLATRSASGQILQIIARHLPNLLGGSADLNASTKTHLKGKGDFQADNRAGNNINFGVREHAMGAVLSGIALHGGFRCFGSTFLVFFDYMKPAVRLAALMGLPVIYVFTHDSIAVGEDGPTHQPLEHLANLRSILNLHVVRPADGCETAAAWLHALDRTHGPTALILSRQDLPQLPGTGAKALKGGYILAPETTARPDLVLIASGSETHLAIQAKQVLEEKGYGVRVVSLPCRELFYAQDESYRGEVLPEEATLRIVVEAALPMDWERLAGREGRVIGIDRFGDSAPGEIIMKKMGITAENIVLQAEEMLRRRS